MEKKRNVILEEGMKRFQQILEYTTLNNTLVDEAGAPEDNGDMPPMDDNGGAGGNNAPMGPDQAGGGIPPMDANGGMMPQQGMDNGMGGDMQAQTPQGFNPQDNFVDEPMDNGENSMQPDDEVVDITELTDKQEETDKNVLKVDAKFDKVMKAIGQFEEIIRNQNDAIEKLAKEYEKRNPTQLEKLSMQSAKGYPFNVSPDEYWKDKEATSNYRTEDDNNGVGQEQYTITKNDLDGMSDWKSISDSMNDDDFMFNQTINKVLGR